MEEDVEIELLLKYNEKSLMEAANEEINELKIQEVEQLENCSFQGKKSSLSKENIYCLNKTAEQPEILSLDNEFVEQSLAKEDDSNNCDNTLKKKNALSPNKEGFLQEYSCIERADDQVNQHLLDLISKSDPVKYYLSKQDSYIAQFGEEDKDYISSEEDSDEDCGYRDDDFIDDLLEDPSLNSLSPENKNIKNVVVKAIPILTSLGKNLMKQDRILSGVEVNLKDKFLRNKARQKELQQLLREPDRIKTKEPGVLRCNFRKFGMPYFSDDKGFFPPANVDHQKKCDKYELITQSLPKTVNWTREHKEMMKDAIKKCLIEEKSAALLKEITELKSSLGEIINPKNGKNNELLEKLTKKQNKLKNISKKSFKELIDSENDNREYDWMRFSASLFDGQHSAEECKRFWHLYLKPSINKNTWSDAEDSKLLELVTQLGGQNWEEISRLLGTNRSPFQCFVHYKARIEGQSHVSNGKWTKGEDKKLLTVINSSKLGDFIPWTKVSAYLINRNLNQIYNRWSNSLNPGLAKGKFSKEEDVLIVAGIEVFGVNFKELASLMNNRTSSQIRERYERHLIPKTAKVGSWSLEEDEKLLDLVQKYSAHNWAKISGEMKTRTRTQVRQRYNFIQKMRKRNPDWTIAQVKRRGFNDTKKNVSKTNKDVAIIKRNVDEIKRVFHLTDLDKETFLLGKLKQLKDNIASRKLARKGRKRKELSKGSHLLNNTILDLFTNCYSKPCNNSAKTSNDDIDSKLNELFLLEKFLGHKLKLPKSENEICNNPRLNYACKNFLLNVLDTSPQACSSQNPLRQQTCSSITQEVNDSTENIDLPVPEHDDTIIMVDSWHTPPVNVANFNFNEFLKRTVFDYSYGMHKDIWDSKLRRSQVSTTGNGFVSLPKKEEPSLAQRYFLPPNQFTTLGKRSILLSKAILERQSRHTDVLNHTLYGDFKKEVNECSSDDSDEMKVNRDVIDNVCNQFKDNLLALFAWPQVLSTTQIGTVPLQNVKFSKKKQAALKRKPSCSGMNSGSIINKGNKIIFQEESLVNENCISQGELVSQENLNQFEQLTTEEVSDSETIQTEHLIKKRKLGNKPLKTGRKRNCRNLKNPRLKSVKRTVKYSINNSEKNNLNESNLSSTNFTYSGTQNSTRKESDNLSENQVKDSRYWSNAWSSSDNDESSLE